MDNLDRTGVTRSTKLVLEALHGLRGKVHTYQIYDYVAKEQGKAGLTSIEKHHVRSALFHLKQSGQAAYHGNGTYSLRTARSESTEGS